MELDLDKEILHHDGQIIHLTPRAFALLNYLRQNSGHLVSKKELIESVWPTVHVSDGVIKVAIRELRKVLGDDAHSPRFIETVHGRGYRFIGRLPLVQTPTPESLQEQNACSIPVVGREHELVQLELYWQRALQQQRQLVFVSGDPGIGKSTLLQHWVEKFNKDADGLSALGCCHQQHTGANAYMPILDGINRLCRGPQRERVKALLKTHAPTWLLQLPWLLDETERKALKDIVFAATAQRMQRELGEFIEQIAIKRPLLLLLEDLHWSDQATLDLLTHLAYQQKPARLMVVCTLRYTSDANAVSVQQVMHTLVSSAKASELPLALLSQAAVSTYLQQRCPGLPAALADLLHQRSQGHPLFLSCAVDHLCEQKILQYQAGSWQLCCPIEQLKITVPQRLQQVFEQQLANLSAADQHVLKAASVMGDVIAVKALAAMLEEDTKTVDECCEHLAGRRRWLCRLPDQQWPDGAHTACYRFNTDLHRQCTYNLLPSARRRHYHRRLAATLEAAYGERCAQIAVELADHFSASGDVRRTVFYLQRAAEVDSMRFAQRDAARRLERAITLLQHLPEAERVALHIRLLEKRNQQLLATGELKEAAAAYQQLITLARRNNDSITETKALLGLGNALFWLDRQACLRVGRLALARSAELNDPLLHAQVRGWTAHWQAVIQGYRPEHDAAYQQAIKAAREAGKKGLECQHLGLHAYLLTLRSDYPAADRAARQSAQLAKELGYGHQYLVSQFFRGWALFYRGYWGEMQKTIAKGRRIAEENGHLQWVEHFQLQQAWLLEQCFDFAGTRTLCQPLLEQARARAALDSQYFLSLILLARSYLGLGQAEQAWEMLGEIQSMLAANPDAIDWVLRLPLQLTLSECSLARQRWQNALQESERLCELAERAGNRTYASLGQMLRAQAFLAQGNSNRSCHELQQAEKVLQTGPAPVAAWRVYAVSAHLQDAMGAKQATKRSRRKSAEVLQGLFNSLEDEPALQQQLTRYAPNRACHSTSAKPLPSHHQALAESL